MLLKRTVVILWLLHCSDVNDPELTPRQKQLLEFPPEFCNTPEQQYAPYTPLTVHEQWSSRGKGTQCFTTVGSKGAARL